MSIKLSLEPSAEARTATVPTVTGLNGQNLGDQTESLFEEEGWLYAFCRERLFRDDTDRIGRALWPDQRPPTGTKMIELGCGPGFYACRFACRFPQISVIGVDRSNRQLARARARAQTLGLRNCRFRRGNVLDISYDEAYFDVLIASRLFTVLKERELAVAEMYRVMRPGGRCLVAEPRNAFRASIPLAAMWLLARATHLHNGYGEPRKAAVLSGPEFAELFSTQPWKKCDCWRDGRYQYALCEKA